MTIVVLSEDIGLYDSNSRDLEEGLNRSPNFLLGNIVL